MAVRVTLMVREVGRLKPDYSLKFDLPALPRPGDYISIFRPDAELHSEDVIVRQVWWELHHDETGGYATAEDEKIGRLREIIVECDQAIGPTSRDHWRDALEAARNRGVEVVEFSVGRISIRESDLRR